MELWTNGYCVMTCFYYSPDQVEDMTEEEYNAYKDKVREKARENYKKRAIHKNNIIKTSWQWLALYKRKVNDDAEPIERTFTIGGEEKTYFYYRRKDTRRCSDKKYNELKDAYIKKYGGWKEIDLRHTTYNGKKWY